MASVDRAKDKVRGYSHGMRQRLGIASALLRRPRLLILDEPTTGLDPAGMRDMRRLVRDLAERGFTVLLSSHLLVEVDELCNRMAIIRRGRIAYEGSLAELRQTAGLSYRVRTTDDDRARAILARQERVSALEQGSANGLAFKVTDESAVAELSTGAGGVRGGDPGAQSRSTPRSRSSSSVSPRTVPRHLPRSRHPMRRR